MKGPGATVICSGNALLSITNDKLPVAYQSLAVLELRRERVSLEVGGTERILGPRLERALPVSSLVREGRIHAESDPMYWEPLDSVELSRTISITYSDVSQVCTSLSFRLKNNSGERRLVKFRWELALPRCVPFAYSQQGGAARPCPDGEFPREARQRERLCFSFDSQRFEAADNRLLLLSYHSSLRPSRVITECDGEGRRIEALFTVDLRPGETRESVIELDFLSLMRQQVSSTIFLIARTDRENRAAWQGAVAAASTWIDRLETCREEMLCGPGFRRFAPFLWFERDKPLPDQVLRFIHNMPCLERVVVFGEVLQHDLENLLTALLDKGGDRPLRLHLFTDNEYYRDRVNVLRGNIQARMIIADETAERVRRLEEIVRITVVQDPCRLPLALRAVMEEMSAADYFTPAVHDTNVFVVPSEVHQARLIAAACVPLARHLGAPVLLWSPAAGPDILNFLRGRKVLRLFLVGSFSPDDEQALRAAVAPAGDGPADGRPASIVSRIPYSDPVRASAALSRLFRAHYLLDWLLQALRAERSRIAAGGEAPLNRLARSFLDRISGRSWAKRNLAGALESAVAGGDFGAMLAAYQDVFVGRDEFLRAFKEHFMEAALTDPSLLGDLAPVWNDLIVLSDFTREGSEHVFSAACFAAYHGAPFLLFPAISQEKELFLDQRVREFERKYFNLFVQEVRPPGAPQEPAPERADAGGGASRKAGGDPARRTVEHADILNLFAGADQLATIIFPSDVRTTVEALNPLTVALFNSDVKVPYEAISGRTGPLSLNFAVGRLAGANAFETSIITSAGMLFAPELQRQHSLNLLLCMANLPGTPPLNLGEEEAAIRGALVNSGEKFRIETLSGLDSLSKDCVLEKLGGSVHIFHFSGHGQENAEQPQRSGILLWDERAQRHSSLNALEVKYRTKLGAHPVVFLNTCFGSSNSRIRLDGGPTPAGPSHPHDQRRAGQSMSAFTTEQIIGVSSSFIHSGSAAVMAPLWEMFDTTAIEYARCWYTYIEHGCSISEAALLAKCDVIGGMYGKSDAAGFRSLSYVIYGDPTLRLFPLAHLVEAHPETARRLLELKRTFL